MNWACFDRIRGNGFKPLRGWIYIKYEDFFVKSMTKQVGQKAGGCPTPGKIQGQIGQGSDQLAVVESIPAHCRGLN